MDFHGPYLLDPTQLVIHVNFPKKLRYVAFAVDIQRRATAGFQKAHFYELAVDYVINHASPDTPPPITNDNLWYAGTTGFRYVWGTRIPYFVGWDGTSYSDILEPDTAISSLWAWQKGDWSPVIEPHEFIGLPELPMEKPLSGIAAALGGDGPSVLFSPEAEWTELSGDVIEFDDHDKDDGPIHIPGSAFDPTNDAVFTEATSLEIHMRGLGASAGGPVVGGIQTWTCERACGFDPLGGPVSTSGEYPTTGAGLAIGTLGVKIRHRNSTKKTTYTMIGALRTKGTYPEPGELLLPNPGGMWILCRRDDEAATA